MTLRLVTWLLRQRRLELEHHTVGRFDRGARALDRIIAALEALS